MLRFRINEILDEQERSAYWLAQKLDMDYHNVKKLADGDATMVKLSTLEKLTDTLKVNIDDLFKKIP
ncbi:MAG: helix-turn-helix transcriptional regulator [Eubacterium sp.]|nr:helix-turn-helix transcriptional regulator [Eubacterium sp.]